jgi:hypothetical protein
MPFCPGLTPWCGPGKEWPGEKEFLLRFKIGILLKTPEVLQG